MGTKISEEGRVEQNRPLYNLLQLSCLVQPDTCKLSVNTLDHLAMIRSPA